MTKPTPPVNDMQKTLPWLDFEYATVDGIKLVYTVNKATRRVSIRLPGGLSSSPEALIARGYTVVLPKNLRTDALA